MAEAQQCKICGKEFKWCDGYVIEDMPLHLSCILRAVDSRDNLVVACRAAIADFCEGCNHNTEETCTYGEDCHRVVYDVSQQLRAAIKKAISEAS